MTDHTEMQIPDDVMEEARQAWNRIRNNSMRDGQFFIARAILSERERCAMIVQNIYLMSDYGDEAKKKSRFEIASIIRNE